MMSILKKNPNYPKALKVANRLREKGYRVLFAGGCVRDALLGNFSGDIDIATSASPGEIEGLFKKTLSVGAQFGVIVVLWEGTPFEVATFRQDAQYLDGRRPSGISFSNEKEDALRRDFTVNGLFYDPETEEILDYVKGIPDLEKKIIRTIGNPHDRFQEDKLRLLRAVRFTAKLQFTLDQDTFHCMREMAPSISVVSRERIREEIFKIFENLHALTALNLIHESGLWEPVFRFEYQKENLNFFHALPMGISPELKLLALNWDRSPAQLKSTAQEFKFSSRQNQKIVFGGNLIQNFKNLPELRLADQKRIFRNPDFHEAFQFLKIWQPFFASSFQETLLRIDRQYQEEKESLWPQKLISGEDLKQIDLVPSPLFKIILEEIESLQLEGKLSTREEALKKMKELRGKHEV